MAKFKFCLIGVMLLSTTTLLGAVTNSDTSTITLEAISIPGISVADVDFGDYVIGDATPVPQKAAITLTNGASGRTVDLNLGSSNIDLSDGSGNTVGVGLSINPLQVVLNGSGGGTSEMTVTLLDNPSIVGAYSGTAEVIVQYN